MEFLDFSVSEISCTFNFQEPEPEGKEIKHEKLSSFDTLDNLPTQLKQNIDLLQFKLMTPIQKAVIPYLREGKDIMGCSETGSGKTIAYLFPLILDLIKNGPPDDVPYQERKTSHPVSLIIVPTRELAEQVYRESKKLCIKTGINTAKVYGGVNHESQLFQLSYGCDILVATPGRLIDFLTTKVISLKLVTVMIIDEADR